MVYQNLKLGLLKNQIEINNIKIIILKVDKKTDANPKGTQSEAGMLPDKIVSLVDKILEFKGKDINNDTKEFEEEIDRIVWLKPAVGVGCMV